MKYQVFVPKEYRVTLIEKFGAKYTDDCTGIAYWYYTTIDPHADDIRIKILGDFHQTFPNDAHLSVMFNDDVTVYHLSFAVSPDGVGYFYQQHLTGASKKTKKTKKKKKKKKK